MKAKNFLLSIGTIFLCICNASCVELYRDSEAPLDERINDLIGRMTLDEKSSLLVNTNEGVERLGVPAYDWWNEALHGIARAGYATVFPQAIGLGAMWDPSLLEEVATVISVEGRAKHHQAKRDGNAHERYRGLTFWSPNINIFRDPRWGRGQETYGEDPYLTSRMGVAFVRGLQGDDPTYLRAAACAKHFAVHSGPESERHHFYADPEEVDFYNTYLPAFEALANEAKVEAFMMAYNAVYGEPCSISSKLYDLLYNKWEFEGHIVSDCESLGDLHQHYNRALNEMEAEALALQAGLCLKCGEKPSNIAEAVRTGLIPEWLVDERLYRLLRTQFRLGFYDPAEFVPYASILFSENDSEAHSELARKAAQSSIVLLKNNGLLPLDNKTYKKVLVVGPNADSLEVLLGNYSGTPSHPVTLLQGIRSAMPKSTEVIYVGGCELLKSPDGLHPIEPWFMNASEAGNRVLYEFFVNPNLEGQAVYKKYDNSMTFKFPSSTAGRRGISLRISGELKPTTLGTYQFNYTANDGYRIYFGEELVLDAWDSRGSSSQSFEYEIDSLDRLPIRLEYRRFEGEVSGSMQWKLPVVSEEENPVIELAKKADLIIFAGGLSPILEGEEMQVKIDGFDGGDRTRIELPSAQQSLLGSLCALKKPIVYVNFSGSAVALPPIIEDVDAVIQAWYPGQQGGHAIADILLGKSNPVGRLPLTFYASTDDLPPFDEYGMADRTYRFFKGQTQFAFGHGLSYSTFDYRSFDIAQSSADSEIAFTVSVEVKNASNCDGEEVIQLYVREPEIVRPLDIKSLCGFKKVFIEAGETKVVQIPVTRRAMQRWDPLKKNYALHSGEWILYVGSASDDIRLQKKVFLN